MQEQFITPLNCGFNTFNMNRQKLIELIEVVAANSDGTIAAVLADAIINNRDLWLDGALLKVVNESASNAIL